MYWIPRSYSDIEAKSEAMEMSNRVLGLTMKPELGLTGTWSHNEAIVTPFWAGDYRRFAVCTDDSAERVKLQVLRSMVTLFPRRHSKAQRCRPWCRPSNQCPTLPMQTVKPMPDFWRTRQQPTIHLLGSDQLHPFAQPEHQQVHLRTKLEPSTTHRDEIS